MEVAGVGFQSSVLLDHKATLTARIDAINSRAAELAGQAFNLSSSSQLATILYHKLRLPPPINTGALDSVDGLGVAPPSATMSAACLR